MKLRLDKILDLLIETCYLAIVFFVPIYFSIFLRNSNVFELNKIVLFKILVLLFLFFSLVKYILFSGRDRISAKKTKNGKIAFGVFSLFIVSLLLSSIFSIGREASFWGGSTRFQGLLGYVYYLLFFGVIYFNFKIWEDKESSEIKIKRILFTGVLASFFVSLYGIAQMAGFDFVAWTEPAIVSKRVFSSLGQPNFLASYLLMLIPFSFYFIFVSRKFLNKFLFSIILIFQSVCLFFTYSRGGWLGFIGGMILTIIFYLFLNFSKFKFNFRKVLSIILVVIFGLIIVGFFILKQDNFVSTRIKSSFDLKSGSVASRVMFWGASLDAIKEKPLLGYGLETQKEVFVRYYEKDWAIYGDVNTYPNRAHNLVLDILLTQGILGLIAYLLLFSLIIKYLSDIARRKGNKLFLALAIFLALSSYIISLLFGFTVVATNVYFWLFAGIIFILHDKNLLGLNKNIQINLKNKKIFIFKLIIIFILLLLIFGQVKEEIKFLKADHYYFSIKEAALQRDYATVLELYTYIMGLDLQFSYNEKEFVQQLSKWYKNIANPFLKDVSLEIFKDVVYDFKGDNYSDHYTKALIYSILASKDEEYYQKSEQEFQKAIEKGGEMPINYRYYADLLSQQKKYEEAINNYNQALTYLPDTNSPYINSKHKFDVNLEKSYIFEALGDLYFQKEEYNQAQAFYLLAANYNPYLVSINKKIADIYYLQGDLDKAIWYNRKGMIKSPNDYAWPFSIGILYEEKGDYKEALEFYSLALSLKGEDKEIESRIEKLEKF